MFQQIISSWHCDSFAHPPFGNEAADYLSVDKDPTPYLVMLNFAKMGRYALPYYKPLESELKELLYDRGSNKVDHPRNPDSSNPVHYKDCSDGLAGATFLIYTREHVQYEALEIERETERLDIPDDGFFSSLSTSEAADDVDAELEFQRELYGEESEYSLMDDLLVLPPLLLVVQRLPGD